MLKRWIRELSEVSESISPISDTDKSRKEGLSELVNYLKGELSDLELWYNNGMKKKAKKVNKKIINELNKAAERNAAKRNSDIMAHGGPGFVSNSWDGRY